VITIWRKTLQSRKANKGDYVEVEWEDAYTSGKVYVEAADADSYYVPATTYSVGQVVSTARGGLVLSCIRHEEQTHSLYHHPTVHTSLFSIPKGCVKNVKVLKRAKNGNQRKRTSN
jgi:hypothetical protein